MPRKYYRARRGYRAMAYRRNRLLRLATARLLSSIKRRQFYASIRLGKRKRYPRKYALPIWKKNRYTRSTYL